MAQCMVGIFYFSLSGTFSHGRSRFWYCHYYGLFILTLASCSTSSEWCPISNFIHIVFPLSNTSHIYVCMCIIDTFHAYAQEMGNTSSSVPCLMCPKVLELLLLQHTHNTIMVLEVSISNFLFAQKCDYFEFQS